jgi:hypothetical protein
MKPWTTWLARLGIAGACVMAVGCGGSGVPDPSSDEQAATNSAPPADAGGPAPPPAAILKRGRQLAAARGPSASKVEEAPAEETPAPAADAEKTAAPSKTEGGSATAEMLAVATNSNNSGSSQPIPGTTPAASQGGSSSPMGSAMMQAMQNQGGRPNMGPGGPGPGGAIGPGGGGGAQMRPGAMGGGSGGPNPSDMAGMASRMQMQMGRGQGGQGGPPGAVGGAGMPGRPGGPGGPGGSPADDKPASFRTPEGAVEAFLSALRAKDPDRLAEASALRASLEPPAKNQTLFKKIFDLSLSESELDSLSRNFEGYKIAGENPAKSTARVEVVLQKSSEDGSFHRLVVTVRREGKDRKWGVLHLATPTEFKPLGRVPQRRTGGGR